MFTTKEWVRPKVSDKINPKTAKAIESCYDTIERAKMLKSPKGILEFVQVCKQNGIEATKYMYGTVIVLVCAMVIAPLKFQTAEIKTRVSIKVAVSPVGSQSFVLQSPHINFVIVFTECYSGTDLFNRMRGAGML